MTSEPKKTEFDPDFGPDSEHNRRAAREHRLTYDRRRKVYRDSDGCMIHDKFGQKF